jgi:hypothetical protein
MEFNLNYIKVLVIFNRYEPKLNSLDTVLSRKGMGNIRAASTSGLQTINAVRGYLHELLIIPPGIPLRGIKAIPRAAHAGIGVKCPLFLSDFNKNWYVSTNCSKTLQYQDGCLLGMLNHGLVYIDRRFRGAYCLHCQCGK